MPVKSRYLPLSGSWSYKYFPYGTQGTIPYNDHIWIEMSSISYENRGRFRSNNCYHFRKTSNWTPIDYNLYRTSNGSLAYQYRRMVTDEGNRDWNFQSPEPFSLIPAGFINRSISSMTPKLQSELSLPNFLIELGELKRLLPGLRDIAANILAAFGLPIVNNMRRPSKGGKRRGNPSRLTLGRLAASDAVLWKNYAYDTLVGDLASLYDSVNKFLLARDEFAKRAATLQRSHYKEEYTLDGYTEKLLYGSVNYCVELMPAPVVVTATMRYQYSLKDNLPANSLTSFLSYLGFRGRAIPNIVWNAIPFSFMLDWVFKVSEALESFDPGAWPIDLTIQDYVVSVKFNRSSRSYMEHGTDATVYWNPPGPFTCGTHKLDLYERRWYSLAGLTDFNPILPRIDGLSIRELVLGASLLSSNKRS